MLNQGDQIGPYKILGAIGAGGMGEVYCAHDQRLNRDVAIKVLPADRAADDAARQRFLREARAASALNHPNIITIYESDSFNGMAFIAMEFVRGKTLSALLQERELSEAEAVQYAIQITDALAKAHTAGIIHRDLKPGNIMITEDGLVKVLDFGLARVEAQLATASGGDSPTASASFMSKPGTTLGTFHYMSPEQARGEVADARSDIFSFGVVLFEMLTRERPFEGENMLAVLHALHFGAPKSVRGLRPHLSDGVVAIVDRCLQKLPADRYQNAGEIKRDLRATAGQSATHSAMSINAGLHHSGPAVKAAAEKRSEAGSSTSKRKLTIAAVAAVVAVLIATIAIPSVRHKIISPGQSSKPSQPLAETVPDNPFALQQQAQAYLDRWDLADNLDRSVTLLNRALELDKDYAPAYASLTFAYFEKNRFHADPQWAKQAEQSASRALQLNSDLADSHLAAGVAAMLAGKDGKAENEFRKAASLDPKNGAPHRWMGLLFNGMGKSKQAEDELNRAIALNPEDWRARMTLGVLYYKTARYSAAAAEWEKVTKLTPDNYFALNNLAGVYMMMERDEDAATALQRSLEIKPAADNYSNLGTLRFSQARYADAVSAFEKAVKLDGNNYLLWGNLGDAYRWAPGQRSKAEPAYQNAIRLAREEIAAKPDELEARSTLALYLAKSGDQSAALAEIKDVDSAPKKTSDVLLDSAVVHELCGERDVAFTMLSAALKAGTTLKEIKIEPEFIALRTDVRYQSLLTGK
ncbi:MAG TPA: protein kinase [Candidatus Angelobacter sp.]|nr:protein kinase [Candidatus Angelobacter sp.]